MAFIKLDENHQYVADISYAKEDALLQYLDDMEESWGKSRWLSVARTNIELGFMALRKAITEDQKAGDTPEIGCM